MSPSRRQRGGREHPSVRSPTRARRSGRRTRQQVAIRSVFAESGRPLSPREVLHRARRRVPALGIATVYRALRRFEEAGEIESVSIPGQPDRYELAGLDHHHHFCCRDCARVFDVAGCAVREQKIPSGFEVDGHEVVLFGRCDRCV